MKLVALIVPLGLDTFAVSAALGVAGLARRERLRIPLLFTVFEAGMPLIGLALGAPLGHAIGGVADYLAIGVLIAFAVYTLVVAEADESDRLARLADLGGVGALVLGISISLDELAIGFTLGLLRAPILPVVLAIALQAFVLAQLGLRFGARLGERLRESAEKLAGLALGVLGVVLLVEKVTSA